MSLSQFLHKLISINENYNLSCAHSRRVAGEQDFLCFICFMRGGSVCGGQMSVWAALQQAAGFHQLEVTSMQTG